MYVKKIPIGIKEFSRLIKEDYYFVDKTLMIEEFIKSGSKISIITRPRRFGKTLNMSMMAEFFDITKDSTDIFKDTLIASSPCINHMNQYPVIYISFADAKGSKENLVTIIKDCLLKEYVRYHFIFDHLVSLYHNKYQRIIEAIDSPKVSLSDLILSLSFLMECLEIHYSKQVMVFIDEYDTPFIESYIHGFYEQINKDLSIMLQSALKTSTSLKYGLLTGIQRVSKENIFSELNNINVCSVADESYHQYFGFSTKETKELLHYYGLELNDIVKSMYDGYHFGHLEIYNPWSLINYVKKRKIAPYWVNTSNNAMIKGAIDRAEIIFFEKYDTLIQQGYIDTDIKLNSSFYEDASTNTLWGLFINAGYLTIEKEIGGRYRLRIPNNEVKDEFIDLTAHRMHVSKTILSDLYYSLRYKDKTQFIKRYQEILTQASFHDLMNENSYHMLVLGLSVGLWDEYEIESNRENGLGRCDIILKSKYNNTSYILEFKYFKNDKQLKEKELEEPLNKLANIAICQIIDHQYDAHLTGNIIYIGLAHSGKILRVSWQEVNKATQN